MVRATEVCLIMIITDNSSAVNTNCIVNLKKLIFVLTFFREDYILINSWQGAIHESSSCLTRKSAGEMQSPTQKGAEDKLGVSQIQLRLLIIPHFSVYARIIRRIYSEKR